MQNVKSTAKNRHLTTGLMMIIKASTILYTYNINHLVVITFSSNDQSSTTTSTFNFQHIKFVINKL